MFLLLDQDKFKSPVRKANDSGTLQDSQDMGEDVKTGDLQGWMLGPKDIKKEAQRLHRMLRKRKAAVTRRNSTVCGFMQESFSRCRCT
jgi:hypothetical protein